MDEDLDVARFPPRLDEIAAILESAEPVLAPGMYSKVLERICGATDDSQEVEQYDGTLGVTVAFVGARQRPVGQLQWNENLAATFTTLARCRVKDGLAGH